MAIHTESGLRAGWEPDAPAEDTLVRRYLLNAAASNAGPAQALGGRVVQRDDVVAADVGRPTGFVLNTAVLLQPLDGERGDELLDALEAFDDAEGTGTVTLISAWPTPDLRRRGWHLEGHPPLLVRPPSGPPAIATPPDLRIVEAASPEHVEDWCRVAVEGFPFAELQPYQPGSLLDQRVLADGRLRLWVGYDADEPVCVGSLFCEHGLGHFSSSPSRCRRPAGAATTAPWPAIASPQRSMCRWRRCSAT